MNDARVRGTGLDARRAAVRDSNRERLTDAMIVVLTRDGYAGSKVADIAAEAHVSLRTFYQAFEDKEECFLSAYHKLTSGLLARDRKAENRTGDLHTDIARGFRRHLRELTWFPRLTYATVIEAATISDRTRQARSRFQSQLAEQLVVQINTARAADTQICTRQLELPVARLLVSGLGEMMIDLICSERLDEIPDLAATASDLIWAAIVSSPSE